MSPGGDTATHPSTERSVCGLVTAVKKHTAEEQSVVGQSGRGWS